jgi:hypothetical protein
MLRKLMVAAPLLLLAVGGADAQQITIQNRAAPAESKGEIRVQVNISFFVPGLVNSTEASLKSQEDARSALYHSAVTNATYCARRSRPTAGLNRSA